MHKKLIALAIIPALLLASCGNNQQSAANTVITAAEAAAPAAASLAVSEYLKSISDSAKQAKAAAYFYAAANGLYTFSSGTTPSPADVQQVVSQFTKGFPGETEMANLVLGLYSSIYPQFGIAGKSATVFLINTAQGIMNASAPYLNK
jgi:hypothetical protein